VFSCSSSVLFRLIDINIISEDNGYVVCAGCEVDPSCFKGQYLVKVLAVF
jgi:hypothetical protein